jgi:radical SAM protein with 4Fe4S-binding SPASM domain
MDFLVDYIIEYGIGRHIRLGLAHPIPGAKNLYIQPKDFHIVKDTLMRSFEKMESLDIIPGFDCGFPMCMFDDAELGKIFKLTLGQLSFQCGPAIDIGTDLSCWSCFPLSDFNKKSLFDFNSYRELHDFYEDKMREVRRNIRGLYLECDTCEYNKLGLCSGGCLAHILNAYIEEGGIR